MSQTPVISIVSLNQSDVASGNYLESLHKIALQWQYEGGFWSFDSCVESITSQPAILCAYAKIENEKDWLGWYMATVNADHAELLFVFTSSNRRGQGLGQKLMHHLIKRLSHD